MKSNKIPKFYIPVGNIFSKHTLVSANKIKELEDILPTEEMILTHQQIQRLKVLKDDKYKPEPLYLSIDRGIFESVINLVKKKTNMNLNLKDHIPLVIQSNNLPIVIINVNN